MAEHLIDGEFQSDKYPWCKRGFVPLKLTDPNARTVLRAYAELRRPIDAEFSKDLLKAITIIEPKKKRKMDPGCNCMECGAGAKDCPCSCHVKTTCHRCKGTGQATPF